MKHEKTHSKTASKRKATSSAKRRPDRSDKKSPPQKKAQGSSKEKIRLIGKSTIVKYEDIGEVSSGGRIDTFWADELMKAYYEHFSKGNRSIPKSYKFQNHHFLLKHYGLKSWEFGNWVTQEDRMNYVAATGISLLDMKKVLGFTNEKIGLYGKLGIANGARGRSTALAHFEPSTFVINMTRYKDKIFSFKTLRKEKVPKDWSFTRTGGVGSFAHEYGHALDYFFGGFVEQDKDHFALTQGRRTRTRADQALMQQKGMRGITERLLHTILWQDEKSYTNYYQKLKEKIENNKLSDYWLRRNELFARAFEQYVGYKLKQKGMVNSFLHKAKYEHWAYMDQALLKKVVPIFDELIRAMRQVKVK